MDIFFTDPSAIPLPPDEVRIRELHAEPHPDGRRVRVSLETDPFQQRPNAELMVLGAGGELLAETSIIQSMFPRIEVVLHLRGAQPGEACTLQAMLYYASLPAAPGGAIHGESDESAAEPPAPEELEIEPRVVDRREVQFYAGGEVAPGSLD